MSWQEKLKNVQFTIKTGDGKIFKPLWISGEKSKEFNISKYDFIKVKGSFIDRKKPQSNLFPLVFYFQGENNIEQCDEFEKSADDNRLWTVEHPFYGTIKGQPTNLKRNDTSYNVTEVTVDFWESIDGEFPESEISIKDKVKDKVNIVNKIALDFFVENSNPTSSSINLVKDNIVLSASKFKPNNANYNDYKNTITKAIKSSDKLVINTKQSFNDVLDVVKKPSEFISPVLSKINSYKEAYGVLKNSVDDLFSKYNFESQAASIIAGMCLSCVNPLDNDYITRNDIENVNNIIINLYNNYLKELDGNEINVYDIDNSWSANIEIQSSLMDLVFYTSNSLFLLSFNARQERTYELTSDSNLIILTHKFLGLDFEDKNLEKFKRINNIKNDELFKIKKGRQIKYFI